MIVLGIDVAKAKLDAALRIADTGKGYDRKAVNSAAGIDALLAWALHKSGQPATQLRVVMEATGVYHELTAQRLYDAGCEIVIANPKRVRDFAKGLGMLTKTDRVDARALVRYGEQGQAAVWVPPPPEIKVLRALLTRLSAIEEDLRREENRWEKVQIADTPELVRASLQRNIESLRQEKQHLLRAIKDHFDPHPGLKAERDLLRTIPAIGRVSAEHLLCLLRGRQFDSARQAAALSGLVPLEFSSGSSVRGKPRLSRQGNPKLRAVLYMAAVSALLHNPELKAIYDRLRAQGKAALSALGALMRHIVHIAYGVLKHQQPYNPKLVSGVG